MLLASDGENWRGELEVEFYEKCGTQDRRLGLVRRTWKPSASRLEANEALQLHLLPEGGAGGKWGMG